MNEALLLQFDALYPPGRVAGILRDFGIPVRVIRLDAGERVPEDLDEVRLLVLLGGRLRVKTFESGADRVGPVERGTLEGAIRAAKAFVDADRPVVGMGFGAELLSYAAGAKVSENRKPPAAPPAAGAGPSGSAPAGTTGATGTGGAANAGGGSGAPGVPPSTPGASPNQTAGQQTAGEVKPDMGELITEFGWSTINLPFPGGTEPVVFGLVDGTPVFGWHVDTFALPALPPPANPPPPPARPPTGNVLIASSRACRHQAYRFKNNVFGFQFQLELEATDIDRITTTRATETESTGQPLSADAVAKIREDSGKFYARYDRAARRVLTNLVQFLKVY